MTIFNILNSILFSKKYIDLNQDDESQFNCYMVNRWMCMYSIDMVSIINDTSNRYGHIIKTKRDQFNWLYNFFPRLRFKRISYIKKAKAAEDQDNSISNDELLFLAKNMEISSRELRDYRSLGLIS